MNENLDRPTVPNKRYAEGPVRLGLDRPCPTCRANPGEECRTKKAPRRVVETHVARLRR